MLRYLYSLVISSETDYHRARQSVQAVQCCKYGGGGCKEFESPRTEKKSPIVKVLRLFVMDIFLISVP